MDRGETVFALDDDPLFLELLAPALQSGGFRVEVFTAPDRLLASLDRGEPGAICLDLHVPGYDDFALLAQVRRRAPSVPVIMLTADAHSEAVVNAMRGGAFDYVTKPFSTDRLLLTVRHAVTEARLARRIHRLEHPLEGGQRFGRVYSRCPAMLEIFRQLDVGRDRDIPVLIHGETGSGKTVLAREAHGRSARRNHPFVELNLSTMPEPMQAAALFGYSRSPHRESTAWRRGLLDQASGGTLLLRGLGDMGPAAQTGLLQLLERGVFLRVGGSMPVPCDVRLMTTTSRDLLPDVAAGRFRESLYFRLAVFDLHVPPLRARHDDILPLAAEFLREHGASFGAGQNAVAVSPDAADVLLEYAWPGNVRELSNTMQRAVMVSGGHPVTAGALPTHMQSIAPAKPSPLAQIVGHEPPPETLEGVERRAILAAMARHGGSVAAVARELDVSRATLYRKLTHYRLASAGTAE